MDKLNQKKCTPCEGGSPALSKDLVPQLLAQVPEWTLNQDGTEISRDYKFKNFYQTMAFVNAVAWIANKENHHPDLEVGFNHCKIHYKTHAIGGLSENDFICAAKINSLEP